MNNLEQINTYIELTQCQEKAFISNYKSDYQHIQSALFLIKGLIRTQEVIADSNQTVINLCTIAIDHCNNLSDLVENREQQIKDTSINKYHDQPHKVYGEIKSSIDTFHSHYVDITKLLSLLMGIRGLLISKEVEPSISKLMRGLLRTCGHFLGHLEAGVIMLITEHKLLIETTDFDCLEDE